MKLDTAKVAGLISRAGIKLGWLAREAGIPRSSLYLLLKYGILPVNPAKRSRFLSGLARALGCKSGADLTTTYGDRASPRY
jgi:hypothetical protein